MPAIRLIKKIIIGAAFSAVVLTAGCNRSPHFRTDSPAYYPVYENGYYSGREYYPLQRYQPNSFGRGDVRQSHSHRINVPPNPPRNIPPNNPHTTGRR
jgi:hypothetical protein